MMNLKSRAKEVQQEEVLKRDLKQLLLQAILFQFTKNHQIVDEKKLEEIVNSEKKNQQVQIDLVGYLQTNHLDACKIIVQKLMRDKDNNNQELTPEILLQIVHDFLLEQYPKVYKIIFNDRTIETIFTQNNEIFILKDNDDFLAFDTAFKKKFAKEDNIKKIKTRGSHLALMGLALLLGVLILYGTGLIGAVLTFIAIATAIGALFIAPGFGHWGYARFLKSEMKANAEIVSNLFTIKNQASEPQASDSAHQTSLSL